MTAEHRDGRGFHLTGWKKIAFGVGAVGLLVWMTLSPPEGSTYARADFADSEIGAVDVQSSLSGRSIARRFWEISGGAKIGTAERLLYKSNVPCGSVQSVTGQLSGVNGFIHWRIQCDAPSTPYLLGLSDTGLRYQVFTCDQAGMLERFMLCRTS